MNPPKKDGPPSGTLEKCGYLLMLRRFVGSKSERLFPCLVGDDATLLWLKHRDDNSFTHASLRDLHRRLVKVSGALNTKGDMIVDHVLPLENPSVED